MGISLNLTEEQLKQAVDEIVEKTKDKNGAVLSVTQEIKDRLEKVQ